MPWSHYFARINKTLAMRLRIAKSPNETLALSNCVIGNPDDFGANVKYIRIDSLCVFTLKYYKFNLDLTNLILPDI